MTISINWNVLEICNCITWITRFFNLISINWISIVWLRNKEEKVPLLLPLQVTLTSSFWSTLIEIQWRHVPIFIFSLSFICSTEKRIVKFTISERDLLLLVYYVLRVECNIHMQTTNLHLKKQHGMWEISNRRWIYSIVIGWNI